MKVVNKPILILTPEERKKILEVVDMLYDTDNETDAFIDDIMENLQGCSLLGILEEILARDWNAP